MNAETCKSASYGLNCSGNAEYEPEGSIVYIQRAQKNGDHTKNAHRDTGKQTKEKQKQSVWGKRARDVNDEIYVDMGNNYGKAASSDSRLLLQLQGHQRST